MNCAHSYYPENYVVKGWPKIKPTDLGEIFWHIGNFGDFPKHKTILAFEKAYAVWQEVFDSIEPKGRVIKFASTAEFDQAHTTMWFLDPKKKVHKIVCADGKTRTVRNNWPFEGPMGVLAHVIYGTNDIQFDKSEPWSEIHKYQHGDVQIKLWEVTLHEIGHTLDLGHSSVKDAIMYASYSGTNDTAHDDDRRGILAAWGDVKTRLAAKLKQSMIMTKPNDLLSAGLHLYGLKEVEGTKSNQSLLNMIREYIPGANDDSTTAWCSIFMNFIAKQASFERSDSAAARSWLQVGKEVPENERQTGDVVIFWRGSVDDWRGHVGIYINDRNSHQIRVLGGNQNDEINIRSYNKDRVLGYRRLRKI